MPDDAIGVLLSCLDYPSMQQRAAKRADAMVGRGTYGNAAYPRQMRGLLGEDSVQHWLSLGPYVAESIADTLGEGGDLRLHIPLSESSDFVRLLTVEVKTMTKGDWQEYGPSLNPDQARRLRADVLFWVLTGDELRSEWIWIIGWWTLADVQGARRHQRVRGVHGERIVASMRKPGDFRLWLAEQILEPPEEDC